MASRAMVQYGEKRVNWVVIDRYLEWEAKNKGEKTCLKKLLLWRGWGKLDGLCFTYYAGATNA
jgi:hypothetical protein